MALALLFKDSSVLYIDATTNYTKSLSSNIASNPLDNATVVADHVAKNSKTFSIQGVISSADFQETYTRSLDLLTEYGMQIPSVFSSSVSEAVVGESGSIGRIFSNSLVSSILGQQVPDVYLDDFRGYSHEVARDKINAAWEASEEITLLDYNYDTYSGRTVSVRAFANCLIENFSDVEDVQTGDALEFSMTLKQVRFAYLKKVEVSTTSKTAKKSNKGKVSDSTGDNKATSSTKAANTWNREGGYKDQTKSFTSLFGG